MSADITINLPSEMESELAEVTREEGLSQNELIQKAISDYLFIRKFRSLRGRLMHEEPQELTDHDMFEIAS